MSCIEDSVRVLEERTLGSGCEDGAVSISVDPDRMKCQYEHGVCMVATFGGKTAEFVTDDPTRATTKVSFMFGAKLGNPRIRAAACAIINVLTGFLCINRVLHACSPECHGACLNELKGRIGGRKVHLLGFSSRLDMELKADLVDNIAHAEVILINGEGLVSDEGAGEIPAGGAGREMLCIGPSTSGVATLEKYPHWCPYGR